MCGCPMSLCIWCMHQYSVKNAFSRPLLCHLRWKCNVDFHLRRWFLITADALVFTLYWPLFTFVAITNCKDGSCGRTTTSNVVDYQSKSDRIITNWSLVVANCLSWCLLDSSESIIHMLSKDVAILTWRCSSRMTTTHSVIGTVCGVIAFP